MGWKRARNGQVKSSVASSSRSQQEELREQEAQLPQLWKSQTPIGRLRNGKITITIVVPATQPKQDNIFFSLSICCCGGAAKDDFVALETVEQRLEVYRASERELRKACCGGFHLRTDEKTLNAPSAEEESQARSHEGKDVARSREADNPGPEKNASKRQ